MQLIDAIQTRYPPCRPTSASLTEEARLRAQTAPYSARNDGRSNRCILLRLPGYESATNVDVQSSLTSFKVSLPLQLLRLQPQTALAPSSASQLSEAFIRSVLLLVLASHLLSSHALVYLVDTSILYGLSSRSPSPLKKPLLGHGTLYPLSADKFR